jgi:hypothetical protein
VTAELTINIDGHAVHVHGLAPSQWATVCDSPTKHPVAAGDYEAVMGQLRALADGCSCLMAYPRQRAGRDG